MDMQGTPIGSSAQGMKVVKARNLNPTASHKSCPSSPIHFPTWTPSPPLYHHPTNSPPNQNTTDPASKIPKEEGPGAIASDSLAAESARSGGAFSENRNSEPLSVSGSNATFNTTDTSGATELSPAPNSQSRDTANANNANAAPSYESARSGGSFTTNRNSEPGSNATSNNTSTSSATETSPAPNSQSRENATNADAAPGYVSSVYSAPTKSGKPHGKNITEGGFDADDSQNASFTAEVGSEEDPGRKAEGDFQKMSQSASGGTGPRQRTAEAGARGQGGFENLGEE